MTVTAYNADGKVLDTYTKKLDNQPIDPPEPPVPDEHHYSYDRSTDKLICTDSDCGEEAPQNYTGWATDSVSGKEMYFLNGTFKTDWFQLGEEIYHFDEKTGEAHKLTVLEDIKTTCGEQGHKTVECECGETFRMEYSKPAGHSNVPYTSDSGEKYYVCSVCGRISHYDLTFVDVNDSDWFAPNIDYVVKAGLFGGRSAVIFDPNTPMTRAELVSVLWRNAGSPGYSEVGHTPFDDCKPGKWYTAAVNWAASEGIVNGVGDNLFDPDGQITREQIVTILYRYAQYAKMDISETADIMKGFDDGAKVSDYAKEAMSWAVAVKLIQGDNGNIKPLDNASRAEVATMVMRFAEMQQAVDIPTPDA